MKSTKDVKVSMTIIIPAIVAINSTHWIRDAIIENDFVNFSSNGVNSAIIQLITLLLSVIIGFILLFSARYFFRHKERRE